jgi:hypothetical protein
MPQSQLSGIEFEFDWIRYDETAAERFEASNSLASQRVLNLLKENSISDMFLLCRAWNADTPSTHARYESRIRALADSGFDVLRARERTGFSPLFVGLHWPSLPWSDEEFATETSARFPGAIMDAQVDAYARRIADTPAARRALRVIFGSALRRSMPGELPRDVRSAYLVLDEESGLRSSGPGAAPGHDREPFDPEQRFQMARQSARLGRGTLDPVNALLAPLRQLSFWKMQDRACQFGESTLHQLLRGLLSTRSSTRIHLIGHSFGCIAASAALCGPDECPGLPRPVQSLALIQGSLSLWSYCSDIPHRRGMRGYFRPILDKNRVAGPIVVTRSRFDTAMGKWYPLGAGAARQIEFASGDLPRYGASGTFGLRGPGLDLVDIDIHSTDRPYHFQSGKIFNLECGRVIRDGSGASGAHRDIDHPEIAHAVWSAALA